MSSLSAADFDYDLPDELIATTLGVLMNTRGLMELVVLHVGLDLGVLSPKLFTMMVIMALVTTMPSRTTPLPTFPSFWNSTSARVRCWW